MEIKIGKNIYQVKLSRTTVESDEISIKVNRLGEADHWFATLNLKDLFSEAALKEMIISHVKESAECDRKTLMERVEKIDKELKELGIK